MASSTGIHVKSHFKINGNGNGDCRYAERKRQLSLRGSGASGASQTLHRLDDNLIEQLFAKLNTLLRKTPKRTGETLSDTIGHVHNQFRPNKYECPIWHIGYGKSA